jgi:hypothetical protein
MFAITCACALAGCAFSDRRGTGDPSDAESNTRDGGRRDGSVGRDGSAHRDGGTGLDSGGGFIPDGGSVTHDGGPVDPPDPDAGPTPPVGLSTPCSNGPGWTLFRFHYDGSESPEIDVWDAACSYSYAPESACNVVGVYSPTVVMDGYALAVDGSDYIRVRFSVEGLDFTSAAVYVQARSYDTSASTNVRVWSPLYGELAMGPVDVDWTYDWYGMDWSDMLFPGDPPGLTAIQIYAHLGSDSLAVHAVELCVE